MLIRICHPRKDDYVNETMIMNILKSNYGIRKMVLNLSCLQSPLAAKDGERGTKIPHQIFLHEALGLTKDPSRTRGHTRG
jgi:hypothetical protein